MKLHVVPGFDFIATLQEVWVMKIFLGILVRSKTYWHQFILCWKYVVVIILFSNVTDDKATMGR
jgi:hypothetical protein